MCDTTEAAEIRRAIMDWVDERFERRHAMTDVATSDIDLEKTLSTVREYHIDHHSIDQELLDIASKERNSLFPWRGQFSPQLIELLLKEHAPRDTVVLDPFVGSGTTLFESARRSLSSYGAEINPAAFAMASTVRFVSVPPSQRELYLSRAEDLLRRFFRPDPDLFTWATYQCDTNEAELPLSTAIRVVGEEVSHSPFLHAIIMNTIMQYIDHTGQGNHRSLLDGFFRYARIVQELPHRDVPHIGTVFLCDARRIPLENKKIDLVITSPPYINVFNYHQNYRRAMEFVGWDILKVARSEIGSNRKHRGNRFLTVAQYCIDIYEVLREVRRLLKPNGRVIIVVGRESRVRGVPFDNALILGSLALAGAGFALVQRQERKFTNKFGQKIYEDLLHLVPMTALPQEDAALPRLIAKTVLRQNIEQAGTKDVLNDIESACGQAMAVEASPLFQSHKAQVADI